MAEWAQWYAGLLSDKRALEMINHAAGCEGCETLMADLVLQQCQTSSSTSSEGWRERMSARLSRLASRTKTVSLPRISIAAALFVILLGATTWWLHRIQSPSVALTIIAQTYTQQRPFEVRFSGAKYGPLRVTRGENASLRSPELLSAEAKAAQRLQAHPDDPVWLRVQGRTDLLEGRYDVAIDDLRHAQEKSANSPEVLGDLAMAYVVRGAQQQRATDLVTAVELLSEAIQIAPKNPVLRFNRALAREALPAPHEAADDWREFLKLEATGGWAGEAREHLHRLESLIKKQHASSNIPASDLPVRLFLNALQKGDRTTVGELANDATAHHRDRLVRDLSNEVKGKRLTPALNMLLRAEEAAMRGQPDESKDLAQKAALEFARYGAMAGKLLATYEEVLAFERTADAIDCEQLANQNSQKADGRHYLWIESQLNLAFAACVGMERRFAEAETATARAESVAARARYDATLFQARVWHAAFFRDMGDYDDVLRISHDALNRYWSGTYSLSRAYECYFEIAAGARGLGLPAVAATLSREAVDVAALLPNRAVEGMMQSIYAEDLIAAGATGQADKHFDAAKRLLDSLRPTPSTHLYQAYASLGLVEVAIKQKRPRQGLKLIANLGVALQGLNNAIAETRYGRLKGDLLAEEGEEEAAESAYLNVLVCCANGPAELTEEANSALSSWVELMLHKGEEKKALQVWDQYRPAFRSAPVDVHAVRLIYANLPGGPVVWTKDGQVVHLFRLPIASGRLRAMVQNFLRDLSHPESDPQRIRSLGSELYRLLFSAISLVVPNNGRLWISLDRDFENLPFEALVDSSGGWLGTRYQFSYSLTTRPVRVTTPDLGSAPRLLSVGFGGQSQLLGRNFPELADAEPEARIAAASFPGSALLVGEAANPPALQGLLSHAEIFHFSGHAAIFPGNAAFALSHGALWVSQLSREDLGSCRLAVLAACSTAGNGDQTGNSSGFARAFLQGGVPRVVAARWDVDSRATAALMSKFYEELRSRRTLDLCLSDAAAHLRKDPQYSHPHYWASFGLYCN